MPRYAANRQTDDHRRGVDDRSDHAAIDDQLSGAQGDNEHYDSKDSRPPVDLANV